MKIFKTWLNYFFSFNGSLNRKQYFLHFFVDMFCLLFLIIALVVPTYFLGNTDFGLHTIIFGLRLPVLFLWVFGIIGLAFFLLNRISIDLRRMEYLKINKFLVLLNFIPPISFVFELFLLLMPDNDSSFE